MLLNSQMLYIKAIKNCKNEMSIFHDFNSTKARKCFQRPTVKLRGLQLCFHKIGICYEICKNFISRKFSCHTLPLYILQYRCDMFAKDWSVYNDIHVVITVESVVDLIIPATYFDGIRMTMFEYWLKWNGVKELMWLAMCCVRKFFAELKRY